MTEEVKVCTTCRRRFGDEALFCPNDGTALVPIAMTGKTPAPDPYLGRNILGQVEIRSLIGAGAMGRVYRGHQNGVERDVAIKILHRELTAKADLAHRFLREAKVASRLNHPNVVQIYLAGQLDDGTMYLVMEYVDGISVQAALLGAGGILPLQRALHVALQICDAVGQGHRAGIVHRDIKPENVMLVRHGEDEDFVKVLDFGIARLSNADRTKTALETQAGLVFGTARYLSPEGARGEPVGPTSDVYAIATLVYQMLAGRTPFESDSTVSLLVSQIHDDPPRLRSQPAATWLPLPLEAAIMKNLAKEPGDRDANGHAFGHALLDAAVQSGMSPDDLFVQPAIFRGARRLVTPGAVGSHDAFRRPVASPTPAAPAAGPNAPSSSAFYNPSYSGRPVETVAPGARRPTAKTLDEHVSPGAMPAESPHPPAGSPESRIGDPPPRVSTANWRPPPADNGPSQANALSPAPAPAATPNAPSQSMGAATHARPGPSLPTGFEFGPTHAELGAAGPLYGPMPPSVVGHAPLSGHSDSPAPEHYDPSFLPTEPVAALSPPPGSRFARPTGSPVSPIPRPPDESIQGSAASPYVDEDAGPLPGLPHHGRGLLIASLLVLFLAVVSAAGIGAYRYLNRSRTPTRSEQVQDLLSRAEAALQAGKWNEPPGDNVLELTDRLIAISPGEARSYQIRNNAAALIVRQGLERKASGDLIGALRLYQLAARLSESDIGIKEAIDDVEVELAKDPATASLVSDAGAAKFTVRIQVGRDGSRRVGESLPLVASIVPVPTAGSAAESEPLKESDATAHFILSGAGFDSGVRLPARAESPTRYVASYTFQTVGTVLVRFVGHPGGVLVGGEAEASILGKTTTVRPSVPPIGTWPKPIGKASAPAGTIVLVPDPVPLPAPSATPPPAPPTLPTFPLTTTPAP